MKMVFREYFAEGGERQLSTRGADQLGYKRTRI